MECFLVRGRSDHHRDHLQAHRQVVRHVLEACRRLDRRRRRRLGYRRAGIILDLWGPRLDLGRWEAVPHQALPLWAEVRRLASVRPEVVRLDRLPVLARHPERRPALAHRLARLQALVPRRAGRLLLVVLRQQTLSPLSRRRPLQQVTAGNRWWSAIDASESTSCIIFRSASSPKVAGRQRIWAMNPV